MNRIPNSDLNFVFIKWIRNWNNLSSSELCTEQWARIIWVVAFDFQLWMCSCHFGVLFYILTSVAMVCFDEISIANSPILFASRRTICIGMRMKCISNCCPSLLIRLLREKKVALINLKRNSNFVESVTRYRNLVRFFLMNLKKRKMYKSVKCA